MKDEKVAIVGTVGVPATYGGFETLAENLVKFHERTMPQYEVGVFCSGRHYEVKISKYHSAALHYVPLKANGIQSVFYDIYSIIAAIGLGYRVILLLGVSGAISLPLIRLFSSVRIITNVDGIEWRRAKWSGPAKWFLRFSEYIAVKFSVTIIADNPAIADYLNRTYGCNPKMIPYGGDHAKAAIEIPVALALPGDGFALSICRIEPENNVHVILDAFSKLKNRPIVVVGNWADSAYGRSLQEQYGGNGNIFLLEPIYDPGKLKNLRARCGVYVHGHSAGGTNPSLVEIMHFTKPIIAYDCEFNRATMEGGGMYFRNSGDLASLLASIGDSDLAQIAARMGEIAVRRYTWDVVAGQYFSLLGSR